MSIIRKFLFAMMLVMTFQPVYGKMKPGKMNNAGIEYLNTHFHLYDSLQKRIFRYAEIAYDEYESSRMWCQFLESQGFKVERGVGGIPTAFIATFGSGTPVIGMMAEYDAIKGQWSCLRSQPAWDWFRGWCGGRF